MIKITSYIYHRSLRSPTPQLVEVQTPQTLVCWLVKHGHLIDHFCASNIDNFILYIAI